MSEPLLVVRDLDVFYGRVRALSGVSLHVEEAEIVALLGVNGAGKSTLLKAVSGLLKPAEGVVSFAGREITGLSPHRIVRSGVYQLPGGRGTFPELTVDENLRLAGFLSRGEGWSKRADAVYESFPWMSARRGTPAGQLSGGEQQMLLLGRALVMRPRLLLVDELSLGLAPAVVKDLLAMIDTLHAEGTSVLLVEQHVDLALKLAHRAYFLEKGEVSFEGPAAELAGRRDLLRSVFLAGARAAMGSTDALTYRGGSR